MNYPPLYQFCLGLVLSVISTFSLSAVNSADFRFRVLQTQDGLSNNDVNCIFKDSHGFMWFGTASGLNRYDGYSVTIFHSQKPDSTCLRYNYVQTIQEDTNGRLWIEAANTYSVYIPETESFEWFDKRKAKETGLPGEPDKIYICGDRYLFVVEKNRLFIKTGEGKAVELAGLQTTAGISDIIADKESGQLIVVNDLGDLFIMSPQGETTDCSTHIPRRVVSVDGFSLFQDREGIIWVYSRSGAYVFNPKTGLWIDNEVHQKLSSISVTDVCEDENGNIWLGTDNHGIYIVEKTGVVTNLSHHPQDNSTLPNNKVKALYASDDNGIWIGTFKQGVSIYYASEYKFPFQPIADVNCICYNPNEKSSVWLGTDRSGLIKYNYVTKNTEYIYDAADPECHPITSLLTDSDGDLWIGTFNGGLKRYSNGRFSHWSKDNGLASNSVWSILDNGNGTLWLGTMGGGLQLFNYKENSFRVFDRDNSILYTNFVSSLSRGENGGIYIGTPDGVARLSLTDYSISSIFSESLKYESRKHATINQVVVDSRGLVWIGTREGLEVYDAQIDTVYDISLSKSMPNPYVLGIAEATDMSMWITVGNDIFCITVDEKGDESGYNFVVKSFGGRDGIISGMFNERSMCLVPTGELLLGSMEGVVTVNPFKIKANRSRPKVIFAGMTVKNIPVIPGVTYGGEMLLPIAPEYAEEICLPYDANDITVFFATDNHSNPYSTTYRYKLTGYSDEWVTCAPGMHNATFTNLGPGSYTLHVAATNFDGFSSQEDRIMNIVIATPWWASWWARILYFITAIMAIIFIILVIHRHTTNRLRQQQQKEISEKTEELNQLKFNFYTNISHELRTPLTLILSPVDSMLKEEYDERTMRRLGTIKANASRLLYLVNQLLDFRKNEMAGLVLHLSGGDLVHTISETCASFNEFTDMREISLKFITDLNSLNMRYDNDKFTKLLVNLLSNAVKYTGNGGRIEVTLDIDKDDVVIMKVADNGSGISDEDKVHIFERYYRGNFNNDNNTGTGIGLSLVYEYARLHGGSVEVTDNEGGGTIFTVRIPYRKPVHQCDTDSTEPSYSMPESSTQELPVKNPQEGDKKPAVLFVDDNRDLIEFLSDEFGELYDVATASNGVEALQRVKEKSFDLIVTDLMMPEMDGVELTRRLKSDTRTVGIPLIMLTAKQDMSSIIEGLTLGADDYVTKPFNNEVLSLKIAKMVSLHKRGFRRTLIEPTPSHIEITPLDRQLVDKAVKYVEENISRSNLSVEELAAAVGMSRAHLYKKLSSLTGKSPIEFIRLIRLKRSTQYLAESQLTIAEIAYKLGFNNPKYFSKYFKEEYGILPSEYQGKMSEDK